MKSKLIRIRNALEKQIELGIKEKRDITTLVKNYKRVISILIRM